MTRKIQIVQEYEVSKRLGPNFDYVSTIKNLQACRSNTAYQSAVSQRIVRFPIERPCSQCEQILPFYEFPKANSLKCFNCHYDKKPKNIINKKLKIVETYKNSQWLGSEFDYNSIIRKLHEEKAQPPVGVARPSVPSGPVYKCEVPIEKVRAYLEQCHKNHARAKFHYKNQSYTREVDIQILTGTYLTGRTSVGRRTFRIDRITNL